MKTPAQYAHEISSLNLDEITSAEALEAFHTRLREVEASLNRDLHALHAQYQGRVSSMHIPTARHHSGKEKAEEEHRTMDEQTSKLAPYEDVKAKIEALMAQVDEKRAQLEKAG